MAFRASMQQWLEDMKASFLDKTGLSPLLTPFLHYRGQGCSAGCCISMFESVKPLLHSCCGAVGHQDSGSAPWPLVEIR